jgi:hypothetical protein
MCVQLLGASKITEGTVFSLTEEQIKQVAEWAAEQDRKIAEKQGKDHPYYGCSGGSLSYEFTPTSIGLVVKVTNNLSKESINVTEWA